VVGRCEADTTASSEKGVFKGRSDLHGVGSINGRGYLVASSRKWKIRDYDPTRRRLTEACNPNILRSTTHNTTPHNHAQVMEHEIGAICMGNHEL